jgi:DNA polymerase-3 subunit gamma/tau
MNDFVVSARKYRPVTFDTVIGQASITTTLKNAIKNNHLAHAFLFCGPRGVGKTTCARILAKTINCTNLSVDTEACDNCESCISFNNSQSFNIYELDAASNNSVEDIRSLVDQVRFPPQMGNYKIYIIDEVHMLSASAFNAFLKTLEEPPSYAIFILATTEKHKIIPTILSRCQIFDFNRIKVDDIAKHLEWISQNEKIIAEPDALHIIAQKADGALRDALSMFDQIVSYAGNRITYKDVINNLNILDYDYYFRITDEILAGNLQSVLLIFNELLDDGFDGHHFINGLSSHFRDLLVSKDASTLQLLEVSKTIKEKYSKQSHDTPVQLLYQLLDISNKCDVEYRAAKNQRLHVELALIKMCRLQKVEITEKKSESPTELNTEAPQIIQPKASSNVSEKIITQPPLIVEESKRTYPENLKISSAKTPSIKISSSSKNLKEVKQAHNEPVLTFTEDDQPFSVEQLHTAWMEYAQKVNESGRKQLFSTLNKRKPLLNEEYNIEIIVDNRVQADELNTVKNELLSFMKDKLKNRKITIISTVIEAKDSTAEAYTPRDKFRKMAEKNPVLEILRDQFDLDFD